MVERVSISHDKPINFAPSAPLTLRFASFQLPVIETLGIQVMNEEAGELVGLYEQGLILKGELLNKLIELSLQIEPVNYIDTLPEEIRRDIRNIVREPPESSDDVFIIKYPTFKPGVNIDEAVKKINQGVYESAGKLHKYLFQP